MDKSEQVNLDEEFHDELVDQTKQVKKLIEQYQEFEKRYALNEKDRIITLDVGGEIYKTYLSTLTRHPDSYFGVMLTKFKEKDELDKPLFIDRSPGYLNISWNFLELT